jgi:glutamine cyclotransferase
MNKKVIALMSVITITQALSVKNSGLDCLNGIALLASVTALIVGVKYGR